MNTIFLINNIALGVALAMDSFSVSIVNGLAEPNMSKNRHCFIAGMYGFFQFAMPLIGWFFVHTLIEYFKVFQKFIPWIALILLLYLGISTLREGFKDRKHPEKVKRQAVSNKKVLLQAIATSIDALSVGFTIAKYNFTSAFIACVIIGIVTFILSLIGLIIGRKVGTKILDKASFLGGTILIIIGIEIFISSL